MDPFTGIGLAASLVTLVDLATQGCKRLHDLQSRIKNAPNELQQLAREAETFNNLLVETEKSSNNIGQAVLSVELRSTWLRNEEQMRSDLKGFTELVEKLRGGDTAKSRLLGQIRYGVSDKKIMKCRRAFKSHIEVLNLVQSLMTSRHISHLHATFGVESVRLKRTLDSGFDLIGEELGAIYKTLSGLQNSPTVAHKELLNVITHTNGTFGSGDGSPLRQSRQSPAERSWKKIYWKWSMYQLPIGILTTELSQAEPKSANSAGEEKKRHKVTFKFRPPPGLTSIIFQISYTIYVENKGHALPYWQRTQCGGTNLLPMELSTYLEEGDFLAVGACLSRMSSRDVYQLCQEHHFEDIMGDLTWRSASRLDFTTALDTFHELVIHFSHNRSSPRIRYLVLSTCLTPLLTIVI
jgi:hypothetical protein